MKRCFRRKGNWHGDKDGRPKAVFKAAACLSTLFHALGFAQQLTEGEASDGHRPPLHYNSAVCSSREVSSEGSPPMNFWCWR
jgi:hypothetical protein